jgi:hypothetical protein
MNHSRLAACGLFLSGIVLLFPSIGQAQQGSPWTVEQCRARMEQLFKMAGDPSVDINEVWGDIGDRAGSSFAIYCRIKEASSIKILLHQLANIEADRQETAAAANRTQKLGVKLENYLTQNNAYDAGGINFGGTAGN